jgi:hypothetical protein
LVVQASSAARRRGDDEEGFTVELDLVTNIVHVAAWGFWGTDVARAFSRDVLAVCAGARMPFGLLVDCARLHPQRSEGQEAWSDLMRDLRARVGRIGVVAPNAVTKLQLARIAKATGDLTVTFFPTIVAADEALRIERPQGDVR